MNHLVTFSDASMSRSAELCVASAKWHGVDSHARFTPGNIRHWEGTAETVKHHADIFDAQRGCGFWAFKPLILDATMRELEDDAICIYADAGIEFIDNVSYIIDRVDQDIFLFGNMYEHAHWCKRDIVEAIWPHALLAECAERGIIKPEDRDRRVFADMDWGRFGKQVQASVIFFRVNDKTRAFVKEWLHWCLFEGGRLIDDSPSRLPNHPEFKENRHDQAILTTMAYRDGYRLNWWPAIYNEGQFTYPRGDYPDLGYPTLFHHHRGVKTGERAA